MTLLQELHCHWSEKDAEETHVLCPDEGLFGVEETWETDDGVMTGRIPLCFRHSLEWEQGKRVAR